MIRFFLASTAALLLGGMAAFFFFMSLLSIATVVSILVALVLMFFLHGLIEHTDVFGGEDETEFCTMYLPVSLQTAEIIFASCGRPKP